MFTQKKKQYYSNILGFKMYMILKILLKDI